MSEHFLILFPGREVKVPTLSQTPRQGWGTRFSYFSYDYLAIWIVRIMPGRITATLRLSRLRAATVVR